jgi:tetratricopeptide (TPR) repeat protein
MMEYNDNPTDPRTLMYLARTYSLVNDYQQSVHYMDEMIKLGDINKEYQFYAHYEKACLEFGEIDYNVEKFKKNLIRIQKMFPERGEPFYKLAVFLYENQSYETVSKIMEKLIVFPVPELYNTIMESLIYDYYIPYLYIDTNLKLGKFDKAVPRLRQMLDAFPYDQPLLNIKYAICDKSMFKVEALYQSSSSSAYAAAVGGFEYTESSVLGTTFDLGLLGELHWDSRGDGATTPFNHDVFVGARLSLNDVWSSQLLAGAVFDVFTGAKLISVEAERRLSERWKVSMEIRAFESHERRDPLSSLQQDDYMGLGISRYF